MCGIAGFYNPRIHYQQNPGPWRKLLNNMNLVQKRRGPDEDGIYLSDHCGLAHVRLSIIDLVSGKQPMIRQTGNRKCAIVFNGEIYNMNELKEDLQKNGVVFHTESDTEVILAGYMQYGKDYIQKLNGIFAIAIWDLDREELLLYRDRLGVKPLFYTIAEDTFVFSSELKGLFVYPKVRRCVDREGLCEIFALGPARTPGKAVFKDIHEVLPGESICINKGGMQKSFYWKLQSHPHTDSFDETVEKTAFLVTDAIRMQMLSDVPISTFLSGGVDSSIVTAVCAKELKKLGKVLNTFSFDFVNNDQYFQSNAFQPSQDAPYAKEMAEWCGTNHRVLECTNQEQLDGLYKAVDARDLPCMADIESSMLYFCSIVKQFNTVTLTGECADEIFGGYPWFHKKQFFETNAFPWSSDLTPRKVLLNDDLIHQLRMEDYAQAAYEATIKETPVLPEDSPFEKRRREISYLNLRWFMANLLERMDRTSMYSGLEARVPLADHRIVEYVFSVPWEMKCPDGIVKGLLRHAAKGLVKENVLWRKKSPYPKTYDPHYEALLAHRLKEVISDPAAPIRPLLNMQKVNAFIESPSDYGRPWYGQLMAGPQMLAYMLQINYWLEHYQIQVL